jgi:hypothetical protein
LFIFLFNKQITKDKLKSEIQSKQIIELNKFIWAQLCMVGFILVFNLSIFSFFLNKNFHFQERKNKKGSQCLCLRVLFLCVGLYIIYVCM